MPHVIPFPGTGYWTFENDGEIYDGDYATYEAAYQSADESFNEQCREGDDYKQDQEQDIFMVRMVYNAAGDPVEAEREATTLHYEYYHGDYAEHNTYW